MTAQTTSQPAAACVKPTGCCPPFDPATYHEKEITWHGKPFVKEHVHALLHVPLDMGRRVTKAMRKIEGAKAAPAHALMLSEDLSPWRTDPIVSSTGNSCPLLCNPGISIRRFCTSETPVARKRWTPAS